jgi:hypothetical protein
MTLIRRRNNGFALEANVFELDSNATEAVLGNGEEEK